jgi:lipopolysaccharide cholinephosphotransferase
MKNKVNELFPDFRNRIKENDPLRASQLVMLRILKIVDHICKENNLNYWLDSGTLLGAVRHNGFIPWDDDIDIAMPREDYVKFLKLAMEQLPEDLFLESPETSEKYANNWAQIKDRKSYTEQKGMEGCHPGIYVDIFPFDSYSNSFLKKNFVEKLYKHLFRMSFLVNAPLKKPYYIRGNIIKNIVRVFLRLTVIFSIFNHRKIYKWNEKTRDKRIKAMMKNSKTNYGYGTDVLNFDKVLKAEDIFPLKTLNFEGSEFFVPQNYHSVLKNYYGSNYLTPPEVSKRKVHNTIIRPIISKEEEVRINKDFMYKADSLT